MPQAEDPNRAGQFAAGINSGMATSIDQVLNAPQRVANLGAEWWNQQGKPASWPQAPQYPDPNFAQRGMRAIGMNPSISLDDYIGGLVHRVGEFAGSVALPFGRVKSTGQYASQLSNATLAGTTSVAAGEVAKSLTDNKSLQQVAEAAGSLVPAGVSVGSSLATKAAMRGGATPAEIAANTGQLRAAGIEPTVGQATGNVAAQGTENILARTPFSGLPVVRRAQQQVDSIGQDIAQMSRDLSVVREKPAVGAAIQRGLTNFVEQTSAKFVALDNAFKGMFRPDQKFALDNTVGALGKLSRVAPDLPEFSAGLKDPNIKSWYDRLRVDIEGTPAQQVSSGVLGPTGTPFTKTIPGKPFEGVSMQTLIDVRTDIGTNITKSALLGKKPDAQYTALYSAISKDIETAAKGTAAEAVLARRDNYWKAFRGRVDNFLEHIAENPNKTQAYLDTLNQANVGREQILAVRRSVDPQTWKSVASAKLAQMGQDTKLGEFSLQKFVTEYKKLSDKPVGSNALSAADALFGGVGDLKKNLDTIASASEKVLAGGRIYQNPSGTSTATLGITGGAFLAGSVFEKLLEGDVLGAARRTAEGALIVGGSRALANTLVNPKTVDWLAKSTKIPAENAAQYLRRLTPIIADMPDPEQRRNLEAWRNDVQKRLAAPSMQGVRG